MGWVRISDDFYDHHAHVDLTLEAWGLWVWGLAWANRNLTDGVLPRAAVKRMDSDGTASEALLAAGRWRELDEGRLVIHDYLDFQPSAEQIRSKREKERERWQRRAGSTPDSAATPRGGNADSAPTPPASQPQPQPQERSRPLVELTPDVVAPKTAVEDVFDFWRSECNHPKSLLDNKRRRRIEWALRHYPPEDIADAIRGAASSEFHQGQNANGRVYDDLALILRDAEHLERFRDEYRNGRRKPIPKAWGALERMAKEGQIA